MKKFDLERAFAFNLRESTRKNLLSEHIVRLIQFWQEEHDLLADGWAGTKTQESIRDSINFEWRFMMNPLLDQESDWNGSMWSFWDGPEEVQPTRVNLIKYFGDPETSRGSNKLNMPWYRSSIIECHEKLGNRMPGVPSRQWLKFHHRVEPYAREAFRRASLSSDYELARVGTYNFRHIRHDPRKPLSNHSFGSALDVNPNENRGLYFNKGEAPPRAWTPEWQKLWPRSVTKEFVQAFASCGFAWGADWDEDGDTTDHTFIDPMHFEWVARDGIIGQV